MVSYEEQATAIREQLAKLLEDEEEWTKAAQTLAGIDLDSGKPAPQSVHVYNLVYTMKCIIC